MGGIMNCLAGICGGGEQSNQKKALRKAKSMLEAMIRSKTCGPILVRAAWHDSGTYDKARKDEPWPDAGGAVGSIRFDHEINAGPNAGLRKAITMYLRPIKEACPEVSWADLLQMGSATSIEVMGGPRIPMKYGRLDGQPKPVDPPFGLPDALPPFGGGAKGLKNPADPAEHLRFVFYKYGMDDKDIVALSGAHTIGRAFKDRSGTVAEGYLDGTAYTKKGCPFLEMSETAGGRSWTKNWTKFDNSYFIDMGNGDSEIITFPTDKVLMEDPAFKPHFEAFKDQATFFEAYAASHKKLSELGSKFNPPTGITGI